MLSVGGGLRIDERDVKAEEIGAHPSELKQIAVLRVYRQGAFYNVDEFPTLAEGDSLVFVTPVNQAS
jgi:hypothetical protein